MEEKDMLDSLVVSAAEKEYISFKDTVADILTSKFEKALASEISKKELTLFKKEK